jgi:DNA-binding NarL/FixJ family response regulator
MRDALANSPPVERQNRDMRVLMIDDHVMFLQGLKNLLGVLAPQLSVETADNVPDAVRMAAETPYELILLDWHMGDCEGDNVISQLREVGCTARIIVLSGETDTGTIRQTIDTGAAGFIPKRHTSELMLNALDIVVRGGIYLPPEVLGPQHRNSVARRAPGALVDPGQRFAGMTPRQVEVYLAAARGLPNKLIARELGIAESTVKTHLSAVYGMLGVRNRTEAAYQASLEGIRVS